MQRIAHCHSWRGFPGLVLACVAAMIDYLPDSIAAWSNYMYGEKQPVEVGHNGAVAALGGDLDPELPLGVVRGLRFWDSLTFASS